MRLSVLFAVLLFTFSCTPHSPIDPVKLHQEISELNDKKGYEASLLKLDNIIHTDNASNYDRYNAYLQKALTYKRVFNYPEAINNLDKALEYGIKTDKKEEAEIRVLVEKALITFDSQNYEELTKLQLEIDFKNLNLLNAESHAFYMNVLAVLAIRNKEFKQAESILNRGITILEIQSPKHLPIIYSKLIGLSEHLEDQEKAKQAFDQGMHYAEKYNMDLYKIILHYAMSHFYTVIEDYKNASMHEKQGVAISSTYNAPFENGKLTVLEKELLATRKNVEIQYAGKTRFFFTILSILLLVLITVLLRLFKVSKQRNLLLEHENLLMRKELERVTMAINDQGENSLDLEQFSLTPRQKQIIELLKEGKTNKEIGNELFISENTVKYHLKTIYTILGIGSRTDLFSSN
ncbi:MULTISPECIES: helix-turn-helix transcriptional regulator [Sphingobacterium]|uniref:helix-turn-helix transcriptional regulator n=1 Tax=Sphingobacterium TaxID=28453 RepID=UPI00293BE5C3|nr:MULTISPECIES: helix-turn-helix transcriptional regulator [unclassified Sphingobacterium]